MRALRVHFCARAQFFAQEVNKRVANSLNNRPNHGSNQSRDGIHVETEPIFPGVLPVLVELRAKVPTPAGELIVRDPPGPTVQ